MAKIPRTFRLDKRTLDKLEKIKNEYEKILAEKGFKIDVNNTFVIEKLIEQEFKFITNSNKNIFKEK